MTEIRRFVCVLPRDIPLPKDISDGEDALYFVAQAGDYDREHLGWHFVDGEEDLQGPFSSFREALAARQVWGQQK